MFKSILNLDQYVLGLFQYISNVAYNNGISNFHLAWISYFPSIITIAIDLVVQDRILDQGLSNINEIVKFKLFTFFSLLVCYVIMKRISAESEENWHKEKNSKKSEQYKGDTVTLRVCCLIVGMPMAMVATVDSVSCYLSIFLLTNACAFYFLSCEPKNTEKLKYQNRLTA